MRCSVIVLFVAAVLFSCKKKDYGDVKIIGHAGSGLAVTNAPYHNNSLESVQYALEMEGVAGVEIDIQCSASMTAWMFHNPELSSQTNGSGCINSATDDYLDGLHYSTVYQEAVVRLKDLSFPFDSRELFLDIRRSNECTGEPIDQQLIIQSIQDALPGINAQYITVITDNKDWITGFTALGWNAYLEVQNTDDYLSFEHLDQTTGVCMRNSGISSGQVATVQEQGKMVMLFDMRSPKGIRLAMKKHPNYVLTDDLKATLIEKH